MSAIALSLLLAAALLRVAWNLLLKTSTTRLPFLWIGLVIPSLAVLPVVAMRTGVPSIEMLALVLASSLVSAGYYLAVARAYALADFSLVYPLSRGLAPAFIVVWAGLALAEQPTPAGLAGIALIVVGIQFASSGGGVGAWRSSRVQTSGLLWAGLAALLVSFYTTIDKAGVRTGDPLSYSILVYLGSGLWLTPVVLARGGARDLFLGGRTAWLRAIGGGISLLIGYALVLQALALSKASYVAAVRELSIVLGALAGWHLLGEAFGPRRTLGAAFVFAGIVLIIALG